MQQGNVHFVREAVYSFANALTTMQTNLCGTGYEGICDELQPANLTGEQVRDYLDDVYFIGNTYSQITPTTT